jgi:hypothetical protein
MKVLNNQRIENIVVYIFVIYVIFWYSVGCYFSFPNAEDYSLSYPSRDYGIINGAFDNLINVDGRYTTNFLHGLNPLVIDWIIGYKWMNFLTLCLLFYSLYFLCNSFQFLQMKESIKLALLITVVFFNSSPSPVHQFFNMSGSFVYLYPWISILFWLGSTIRFIKIGKEKWFFLSLLFMYLSFGFNELFLSINSFFVGYIVLVIEKNKINTKRKIILLLIYVIAVITMISSQGNFSRFESHESDRIGYDFLIILSTATKNFILYVVNIVFKVDFLVPIFLIFRILNRYSFYKSVNIKNVQHTFILFVFSFLSTFTYYLPMGVKFLPTRVYSCLLPILFFFLLICMVFIGKKLNKIFQEDSLNLKILFALLIISMLFNTNSSNNIRYDLIHGNLTNFNIKMNDQINKLRKTRAIKNWKSCELEHFDSFPKSIFLPPYLSPNRQFDYWNVAFEKYFYLDEVYLKGDTLRIRKSLNFNK